MNPLKTLSFCQIAVLSLLLGAALPSCSSNLEPFQKSCKNVDCSGHGECQTQEGKAVCVCESGYYADGLECVEGADPCEGVECDDDNVCTDDSCDPATGCVHQDVSTGCDDGNPCTADSCDPANGCVFEPDYDGLPCDDGDDCTLDDECSAGTCNGALIDGDGDGIPPESCGGPDCDDQDPLISGAPEVLEGSWVCTNGLDDDCDGETDSADLGCSIELGVCVPGGWCMDNPNSVAGGSIWGSGTDDIWVTGHESTGGENVYHFDGHRWDLLLSMTTSATTIWGSGPADVWAAGPGSPRSAVPFWIQRWSGTDWVDMVTGALPQYFFPEDIWGSSRNDVWLAGYLERGDDAENGSYLFHWNGSAWSAAYHLDESRCIVDITGTGPQDVWAVGARILHWDGAAWSEVVSESEIISQPGAGLHSVLALAPDDAWAVGNFGLILHWDGVLWTHQDYGDLGHMKIWGLAPDDIWMCSTDHSDETSILHQDGAGWSLVHSYDAPYACWDLWGSSTEDVWAVPGMEHWDGRSWTPMPRAFTTDDLRDVHAPDDSCVWAIGDALVLRRTGTTWADVTDDWSGPGLNAVWASGPDDAWVVGDGGHIAHFDGAGWTVFDSGTTEDLVAVWGASADCLFAVGGGGAIVTWDGVGWAPMESGTAMALRAVHGASADEVWAAGEGPTLLRWDGQAWREVVFSGVTGDPDLDPLEKNLSDVRVFAPDDAWVVVDYLRDFDRYSVPFHWDGAGWSPLGERVRGYSSCRLAGDSPDGFRLMTECCIYSVSADGWSEPMVVGPEFVYSTLEDFAVNPQGSIFAVGSGGTIFRYQCCRTDEDCNHPGACILGRTCVDELCRGEPADPEGLPCDDGLFCNGQDTCDESMECGVHAGDPCVDSLCDESLDICKGETWYGLDGSDAAEGISGGTMGGPLIAMDSDGNPVVSWCAGEKIAIKKFDGASWNDVGDGVSTFCMPPLNHALAVDSQGRPVVAWMEEVLSSTAHSVVYVKRFEGGAWVEVGAGSASGLGINGPEAAEFDHGMGETRNVALAIDGQDRPVVAWRWFVIRPGDLGPYDGVYLRRFEGVQWVEVGAGSASAGGISDNQGGEFPSLAVDGGDNPVVVWTRSTDVLNIKRFDGSAWVEVGAGSASETGVISTDWYLPADLVIGPGDVPVAACEAAVLRSDGGAWTALTGGFVPGAPELALTSAGEPVAAWVNDAAVYLAKYAGDAWVEMGTGSASGEGFSMQTGAGQQPWENKSLASGGGRICVAWEQETAVYVRCVNE